MDEGQIMTVLAIVCVVVLIAVGAMIVKGTKTPAQEAARQLRIEQEKERIRKLELDKR